MNSLLHIHQPNSGNESTPFPTIYSPPADMETVPFSGDVVHRTRTPVYNEENRRNGNSHNGKTSVRSTRGRKSVSSHQVDQFAGVGPEVLAVAEMTARDFGDLVIPPTQREWIRGNLSLRQFYEAWLLPEQQRRHAAGKLSRASLDKTRQALNRWERFTRPAGWPAGRPWPGLPLGAITCRYATWATEQIRRKLGASTTRSTWGHLRTILTYAVRVKAIDAAPRPEPITDTKGVTVLYSDEQLPVIYRALAGTPDLQVAFVVAVNAGLRPVDLFLLDWSGVTLGNRPQLDFVSRKTGKAQCVPLSPVTAGQLQRLRGNGKTTGPVFPGRSRPDAADPERSRPARERRAQFKAALQAVGLHVAKPFQAARATCNERLERTREGVGQFVLGHALTLNAKSYREPSALIRDVVCQVPQPDCFQEFEQCPNS